MRQEPETHHNLSEKEIFFEAMEKAGPAERAAYLDQVCGRNSPLRERMEGLLARHFEPDKFMEEPAAEKEYTSTLAVPPLDGPGSVIGRYKLLEKVGEGGFGAVYVAEQKEPVRRRVALKIIKLGMDTRQVIARFEAERQALALMDHPNIAKVLDAGATGTGRPYFVMELVRGVPITRYCDENHLTTVERLRLFMAVCQAIQHAHQKGIIHRDIKPSNILVTLHDSVAVPKVIDFGIAKATQGELTDKTVYTQFQQFIGTPAYISPEQAEMSGLDMDTRSDIYSLGVLLYELLVGQTPFDGKELLRSGLDEMRRVIREQEPMRPSTRLGDLAPAELTTTAQRRGVDAPRLVHLLRGDLDWIVMKCLEKDRTRRYETASSLALDLTRFLNNEPVLARPPSATYRFHKFARRHRGAVAAALAIALALLLGLLLALFAFMRERQARLATVAAEKARQAETIRADAVRAFMSQLLTSMAPELLRQGHQRPVRELLLGADRLASTALSNAPAVEIELRGLMAKLYFAEGTSLIDPGASYQQLRRIAQLLPLVPEDRLPMPRDGFRISIAASALWAGYTESALSELGALREEFSRRHPPAKEYEGWCLAIEGNWQFWKGESASAEAKLAEASGLMTQRAPVTWVYYICAYLALTLLDRGAAGQAEQIIREVLLSPEKVTPDLASSHVRGLSVLASALCQQQRFEEARELLLDQKHKLSARHLLPRDLLALEKKLGEVLARSGKAREALPILLSVATNTLSTADDCVDASHVAIGSGDVESYRRLCGLGLQRFTAGAEPANAIRLIYMLLAAPQDDLIMEVTRNLAQRIAQGRDFSKEFEVAIKGWLLCRNGNPAEAAVLLSLASEKPVSTEPIAARYGKSTFMRATLRFRSAIALGQLGRSEPARQAYAKGMQDLGPTPSETTPRDLGETYMFWYLAEAHRREAEQVFQSQGIPIPESDSVNSSNSVP